MPLPSAHRLVVSPHADQRTAAARAWLAERARGEEVLVVASHVDAASELVRSVANDAGGAFGWHRVTLPRLAGVLGAGALAEHGRVPIGRLAAEAVVARVVHELGDRKALGRFADSGRGPGLIRAVAAALDALRAAQIERASLETVAPELVEMLAAYETALREAGLADRSDALAYATALARDDAAHPWLGLPVVFVDLLAPTASERALLEAVIARSPDVLATLPAGDARARAAFEAMLEVDAEERVLSDADSALRAMQKHLFEESAPTPREPSPDVAMISAPGESRECVEVARRIQAAAREGVPFDRMAVLLRSPEAYAPFLVEALRRADVPAHFARDTRLPDPSGRAFLALLACAAEDLSARRFSEYLSLGEVPARVDGEPPPAVASVDRWVPPDEELVAARGEPDATAPDPDAATPAGDGTLPAPRRWERLLVDAAVIGGRARWERRLTGMAHGLEQAIEQHDDPEGPSADRIRRDLADLATLRAFALPLVETLAQWPERARWGEWIETLGAMASRALRRPQRVLSVLGELAPMAAVGPVGLREVQLVLTPRLQQMAGPPSGARYGKVYVAPTDAARGLDFDRVFIPGLAEKLFPRKIAEDPILLDVVRERLDAGLVTNADRLEGERLALRLAVGAARDRVVLSFPRLDTDGGRPRVPSFYALETLRAAEGALPGFDELARRAEQLGASRLGWPAPHDASAAIDAAEYDLARLSTLESGDADQRVGTARYLLGANPHLGRALRFRARRWLDGWTVADGFVKPIPLAREAIAAHALGSRSYSPTALQNYSACPYKFYLYAVLRLSPREEPAAIEELDALQRGSLVHDVQFELFGVLRDAGLLPVRPAHLDTAWKHLDTVLEKVAARYEDDLAPAIERVWRDGVQAVRADLREWLRRASEDESGYVPWRFELSFGLPNRQDADPASRPEPVTLDAGLCLRGSIDLVERASDGRVRVTDHKTGKERFKSSGVIDGGRALQPVLYALTVEKLFPEAQIASGRLYYCTSTGNFEEREVVLDANAREAAALVAKSVGDALEEPFLPAAPDAGACRWCDYRAVCGPYEELRVAKKWSPPLQPLRELRERP